MNKNTSSSNLNFNLNLANSYYLPIIHFWILNFVIIFLSRKFNLLNAWLHSKNHQLLFIFAVNLILTWVQVLKLNRVGRETIDGYGFAGKLADPDFEDDQKLSSDVNIPSWKKYQELLTSSPKKSSQNNHQFTPAKNSPKNPPKTGCQLYSEITKYPKTIFSKLQKNHNLKFYEANELASNQFCQEKIYFLGSPKSVKIHDTGTDFNAGNIVIFDSEKNLNGTKGKNSYITNKGDQVLFRYEILEYLAAGIYGKVLKVWDHKYEMIPGG